MREEIREGLKGVRQDIREVAEMQKEAMRNEIERIKELRRREEGVKEKNRGVRAGAEGI